MLKRLISETNDRHSKYPISQEAYRQWRSSQVTKRLFEELELAVIDSFQDYLSDNYSAEQILNASGIRDGAAQMVERVLSWSPVGEGSLINEED